LFFPDNREELFRQDLQDLMDLSFQAFLLARHRKCTGKKAGRKSGIPIAFGE